MRILQKIAQKSRNNLTTKAIFNELLKQKKFRDLFVYYVRDVQLKQDGQDGNGKILRSRKAKPGQVYAPYTIMIRRREGLQTGHIDLKQTGEFYKTFKTVYDDGFAWVEAETVKVDPISGDINDLAAMFGIDILTVGESGMIDLINYAKNETPNIIKKILFK